MAEAAEMHGTRTASVPRRWLRRATAVLAMAPLLMGVLQAAPAAPAAHSAATGSGSRTAEVSITELTPATPDANDTLTVSGTVTNKGASTITGAKVGLRTGPRLRTRSAIDQSAARTGFSAELDGDGVTGKEGSTEIADITAGATRSFTLEVPVKKLPFAENGVYQLGVTVTGRTTGEAYQRVLGIGRTFLPWQTSAVDTKTQFTFLWPLISSSHLTARRESDEQQTPVFRDDALAAEIAPGGRLHQLVSLGKDLPVSWVIDPDLLATVEAMTKPYKVQTADGKVAGKGQDAAKKWLNDLQQATEGTEIIALPFGDPDLASLAHRGKNISGALSHLRPATEVARTTVKTILHTTPNTDFAWPVEGAIDPSIISVATSAGARKVITRSDSLREPARLSYTPNAARPIGGGTTAVSADARLSKLFQGDMTRAENSVLAVQRFLAQTQSITEQEPAKQRSIVIAPQRTPTASQAQTMAAAVSALRENGQWSEFADLSDAAKAKPDPGASRQVPGEGSYPGGLRKRELSTEAFEEIQRTQSALDDFTVILSRDDRVVPPFGSAIRREMSTSWRGHPEESADYRSDVQSYLVGLTREVRLVQKSRMTLSGRSATIPVTVQNNLVQAVDGLELRLKSGRRIGLEIKPDQKPVVVEGGHSQSIKFDATAKANGRTFVEAQLYTKDGKPYGKPMTFQVDVTEITSTVLLVIAGGMLLVVLAGIRMYTQRKRRGPQPDPDAPLGAADAPDQDPESEDTQDTGPESKDSPGSGEKVDR
ncbi:DUF6049 family protein [Streptomyces gobiensis]|uniref:DUF6049 family protein n=1 Tax=Streptomyces gobiensis TaxID=2875706 RepID=UPI001E46FBA2|nr:DUF6049 family protein [Streptomyces gobiensis]UGY92545.1 DUF6049 family protein [Streptomyces gobiensis]